MDQHLSFLSVRHQPFLSRDGPQNGEGTMSRNAA